MSKLTGAAGRAISAGLLGSLILGACSPNASPTAPSGSPAPSCACSPGASPSVSPTAGPAAVLLEVISEGGFINPSASLAALPTVVVYADGRIITRGSPPPNASDGLVQPVSVRDVGPEGAAAIIAAITTAGLDQPATGDPGVAADSGTSVFTVNAGGDAVVSRFAANGPGGPGLPGSGGGDNPERTAAFDLLGRLLDPTDTWGAASAPESTYVPLGYRVFAAPGAPGGDGTTSVPAVAWPLGTGLADFGTPAIPDRGVTGLRSGVVLGEEAQALAPVVAAATTATPFTSGGASFTLWVRPLLPHELPR